MGVESPTGRTLGGFRVGALLARGAMGAVYRAEDADGRTVALKLLSPELAHDERFRRRFLRESQLAATLDHPHVVRTIAAGEDGGTLYLAMAFVDGVDLRELVRRDGPLDPDRTVRLLEQVGEALDAAHSAGLVHRDVKPGNILVSPGSDGERAYVCDFGLARHVSSVGSLTGDRGFVGTVDYVAPEQIRGELVDGRADVYSLGCVLFECLTGERPYVRDSELAVVFAHLNEPPPRATDVAEELPAAFDDVVARALAKSPDDRYATCRGLAEAASTACSGRRVRPSRRRRWVALAGVAAAVLAAAAVGALALRSSGHSARAQPPAISQGAIAGARLGLGMPAYKRVLGGVYREDVATLPEFPVLIFHERKTSVYFDGKTRRGIIITTWNPDFRTGAGVGPCSTVEDVKAAYGSQLRPSRWNTQKGAVYGWTLGRNLFFAANGPPGHPSTTVTGVALYDGDGPRNDGSGVDVKGGTLPFAGYVALTETPCEVRRG